MLVALVFHLDQLKKPKRILRYSYISCTSLQLHDSITIIMTKIYYILPSWNIAHTSFCLCLCLCVCVWMYVHILGKEYTYMSITYTSQPYLHCIYIYKRTPLPYVCIYVYIFVPWCVGVFFDVVECV